MFFKKSVVEQLRQRSGWGMNELPEAVRVPALDGHRPEEVILPLEEATLDDLAFAILGIEAQVAVVRRGLSGLRELYDQARKRGAVGTNTVTEVFFSDEFGEATK